MRPTFFLGRLAAVVGGAAVTWGCAGNPKPVAQAPAPTPVVAERPAPPPVDNSEAERLRREREAELRRAEEAARSRATLEEMIHFDYDRSDIRPGDRVLLQAKAPLLAADPALKLRIDGHADERGSDEYNLALGMRRAASAKRYLVSLGADPNRLEARSFGEEQPLDRGQNERAWARNRRAEFHVVGSGPFAGQ